MSLRRGTPITNTLAELYTVQRFMDTPTLKSLGVGQFDDWASAFGQMKTEAEPSLGGDYRYVTRFADIANEMELSKIIRRFMDVVLPAELRKYVTVPEHESGAREKVHVDLAPSQRAFYDDMARRFRDLEQRSGPPEKGEDNHLTLISDGRMGAMDMRLFPSTGPRQATPEYALAEAPRESTKLEAMIDAVFQIWDQTHDHPFYEADENGYKAEPAFRGQATQLVFASLGYQRKEGRMFLPDYFRAELVDRGVPNEQIAWIGDFKTHDAKSRLFNDMNEGKVTILIGSEESMGTGVNVQKRLYAMHNLGPGWFPSMDEQRVGRGMRQGNMNPKIRVIDYSTRSSYDSNMWQLMAAKAGFIEAFFRGDPSMKFMEDVGDQSTYAMAAAMTTRDPRALKLANMRRDLEQAKRTRDAADDRAWNRRASRQRLQENAADKRARLNKWRKAMAQHVDTSGKAFTATVDGKEYDDRTEGGDALIDSLRKNAETTRMVGMFGGYRVMQKGVKEGSVRAWVELTDDTGFPVVSREVGGAETGRGLISSFETFLRRLGETEASIERNLQRDLDGLDQLKVDVVEDAPSRGEIDLMNAAVTELESEITGEAARRRAQERERQQAADEVVGIDDDEPDAATGIREVPKAAWLCDGRGRGRDPEGDPRMLQQAWDPRTGRWSFEGEAASSLGLGGEQFRYPRCLRARRCRGTDADRSRR